MPNPNDYKDRESFMKTCIPMVQREGTAKNPDQAVAICSSMWKRKGEKNSMKRNMFILNAVLGGHIELSEKGDIGFILDKCTMIVGNKTYNGVYFSSSELEKSYKSFEGVPINLNHSDERIEDIVGYMKNVKFEDNKIIGEPVFEPDTAKYKEVMGYIKSRINAGKTPNVSIGAWGDRIEVKNDNNEVVEYLATDIEGDHLAIVVHGACTPECGCGIGLTKEITIKSEDYVENKDLYEKLKLEIEIEKEKNGGKK